MSMNIWPAPDRASMVRFYGDPDAGKDGVVDLDWYHHNIVRAEPPYPMFLAWEPITRVRSISMHKLCIESCMRVLSNIKHAFSEEEIIDLGLDMFGGAFQFRAKRDAATLSTHAYGAAIDLSPRINYYGRAWEAGKNMMPLEVIHFFSAEGWLSGYKWKKPDAMHFQAAR